MNDKTKKAERKTTQKSLSVIFNVKKIAKATKRNPAEITFAFTYAPYLKCSTDLADDLVNKLLPQLMGGDIKIMDLCLTWFEDDKESVK